MRRSSDGSGGDAVQLRQQKLRGRRSVLHVVNVDPPDPSFFLRFHGAFFAVTVKINLEQAVYVIDLDELTRTVSLSNIFFNFEKFQGKADIF